MAFRYFLLSFAVINCGIIEASPSLNWHILSTNVANYSSTFVHKRDSAAKLAFIAEVIESCVKFEDEKIARLQVFKDSLISMHGPGLLVDENISHFPHQLCDYIRRGVANGHDFKEDLDIFMICCSPRWNFLNIMAQNCCKFVTN